MRRRPVAAVVGLAALILVACGTGRPGLTAGEQNQLLGLVQQARSAAVAGRPDAVQQALTTLRKRITALRLTGALDPARAARIQSVAAQAQSAARARIAAAKPPPTPTPAPAPARRPAPTPAPTVSPPAVTVSPTPNLPTQIIVQGVDRLRNQVEQVVGQGVARLKGQLGQLGRQITGGPGSHP
ncbi:MAG: hypothetical protein LC685_03045 [Actinobacteria bacterium]|nr:hypothetical protein [Actinomycetota bacterium]